MEEQLKSHTAKLEKCLDKFDELLSQLSSLQNRVDSLPTREDFFGLEKRIDALEKLEKRTTDLENNSLDIMQTMETVQGVLSQLPPAKGLHEAVMAIQEMMKTIEDHSSNNGMEELGLLKERIDKQEQTLEKTHELLSNYKRIDDSLSSLLDNVANIEKRIEKGNTPSEIDGGLELVKQIDLLSQAIESLSAKQKENEKSINDISNQQLKIMEWINQENIRPDLDRLNNGLLMVQNKLEGLEQSLVQMAQNVVQTEELEIQLGGMRNDIEQLQNFKNASDKKETSYHRINAFEMEIAQIKKDVLWGIQEMRQRIDTLLLGIRNELLDEEKKRYEKYLRIEMEHQQQIRIAHALNNEIVNLKKLLPSVLNTSELSQKTNQE